MQQGNFERDSETLGAPGVVILESKLQRPYHHPEHVSRPRLLQRLDEGLTRRLTVVDAPVGFGKSTLLAEWCARGQLAGRCAWLQLDEEDNDPVTFWTYVIEALRRVQPDCFVRVLREVQSPGVPITRSVVPQILNALWTLDRQLILVLDDFHLVSDEECIRMVRFFIDRLPPTLHLVIATRSDPPLPLGTWRARGN